MRSLPLYLLLLCLALTGCAKYKAYGVFPGTGEEMQMEVSHNTFTGAAQATGKTADGTTCRGNSRIIYSPPFGCAGQQGRIDFTCTDGRIIMIKWEAESCTSGHGFGHDDEGNKFIMAFGGDETTLRARVGGTAVARKEKDSTPPAKISDPSIKSFGTGFFISADGLMVTNAHVVKGAGSYTVYDPKTDTLIPVKLLQTDPSNDIALLKADIKTKPFPLSARFSSQKGEEVLTIGFPRPSMQGLESKATFGYVNALSGLKNDIRFAQVDLPLQPGNSGGPLLNSRGEVIGITTSTLPQQEKHLAVQGVNYAIKIDYLYPLLASIAPEIKPSAGTAGLTKAQLVARWEDSVMLIVTIK